MSYHEKLQNAKDNTTKRCNYAYDLLKKAKSHEEGSPSKAGGKAMGKGKRGAGGA